MKLRESRQNYIRKLKARGIDNAPFIVDLIFEEQLGYSKSRMITDSETELDKNSEIITNEAVRRYLGGEPLQYILGSSWFMGRKFKVSPGVLIPRPDTEVVCEYALGKIKSEGNEILDLCCGSGCIGLSLLAEKPDIHLTLADISDTAISVTAENAGLLTDGLDYKIIKSDLFNDIPDKKFNMIISNPPYIETDAITKLSSEVKDNEPLLALDGGSDGLKYYRRISKEAKGYLQNDGYLIFEIGYNQNETVCDILKNEGYSNIETLKDYGGNYRLAAACLSSSSKTV